MKINDKKSYACNMSDLMEKVERYYANDKDEDIEFIPFQDLLKELTSDITDMVNEPLHYNLGEIQTLDYIDDVLLHNPNLTAQDGYYIGNILKYLGTRLGTKNDKLEDMQKAQFYLNRLIEKEGQDE